MAVVPFMACMLNVASYYHLPPRVLPSIHDVEGGAVGTVHPNADGTFDFGVMQVNTRWVPTLARIGHVTPPRMTALLIQDACVNIAASGYIMRTYLNEAHGNVMAAVGFDHSHTPGIGAADRVQVTEAAMRRFLPRQMAAQWPPPEKPSGAWLPPP